MRLVAVAGIGPRLSGRRPIGLSREEAENMQLSGMVVLMELRQIPVPTDASQVGASA